MRGGSGGTVHPPVKGVDKAVDYGMPPWGTFSPMISKLCYLIALILFVALAAFNPDPGNHLIEWGLAAIAAGLLLEGVGPGTAILYRRRDDQ